MANSEFHLQSGGSVGRAVWGWREERRWGLWELREVTQEAASRWPFPLGPERQLWVRRLASGRRTAENFTDEKTHRVKANTALQGAACRGDRCIL